MKTIAALATPPGVAGIAVIRVSGAGAFDAIDLIFKGKSTPSTMKSHTIHYGKIVDNFTNEIIDEVVLSIFCSPNSYTGEDVVEISSHGGKITPHLILELLYKNGVTPAEPGEFTKIAFLNGKLDLLQAEAVADIIHSISVPSAQTAARQMSGGFSESISDLRQKLIKISSLLEIDLDFLDDNIEFSDYDYIENLVNETIAYCTELISRFKADNILRSGFHIAIVGFPNSGKSTLFNSLLKKDRAIISSTPGTTRDYIEDYIYINQIPIKLIDTAGLRQTDDLIELDGIKLAENVIAGADLIILLNDVSISLNHSDKLREELKEKFPAIPILCVHNKIDNTTINNINTSEKENNIFISAKSTIGIEDLKASISQEYSKSINSSQNVMINERHKDLLIKAIDELKLSINAISLHQNELASINIRNAANLFGQITGENFNEEVLNSIFSKFCIGK